MNTLLERKQQSLKKRYIKEKIFKSIGVIAISIAFLSLVLLLADITRKAMPAFMQHSLTLEVDFSSETLGVKAGDDLMQANMRAALLESLYQAFSVTASKDKRAIRQMISPGAVYQLRDALAANPDWLDTKRELTILLDDDVDTYLKSTDAQREFTRMNDAQLSLLSEMQAQGVIEKNLNTKLLTGSDSRNPEEAGIRGAIKGTLLTILITLSLSFPIGLFAAVYLEEFAPKNKLADFIEININNLAAVPSIVFGLLGLAVFINLFGIPRSTPLVGGVVLTLMTLPTIIISSRAAIKSVPSSLKEAAIGLGASRMQTVFHHVVPFAMPGVLTGTIIGVAQAIGETAPLLMIGMIAFIVDVPQTFTDPATVLPVQIYLWADSPEQAFVAKTSAAILILLVVLVMINASAVLLRRYFERRLR